MSLWLYATLDGVGSARELDRLCDSDDAYRWLCGGVGVNHHALADFRVQHPPWLDGQLTRTVAALLSQGLVSMNRVAHGGMRVRAHAGAASFRRRETLEQLMQDAQAQVADGPGGRALGKAPVSSRGDHDDHDRRDGNDRDGDDRDHDDRDGSDRDEETTCQDSRHPACNAARLAR